MRNLSNITLGEVRAVLTAQGLICEGVNGGHEKWSKEEMERPVIFQAHVEPVPEFIVRNIIRNLGMTRQGFIKILENS